MSTIFICEAQKKRNKTELRPDPSQSYIYGRFIINNEKEHAFPFKIVIKDLKTNKNYKIKFTYNYALSFIKVPPSKYQILSIKLFPGEIFTTPDSLKTIFLKDEFSEPFLANKNSGYYIGDFFIKSFLLGGTTAYYVTGHFDTCQNNYEKTTKELKRHYPNFKDIYTVSVANSYVNRNKLQVNIIQEENKSDFELAIFESNVNFIGDSGRFIDSRDHQKYKWLRIGNQIWMAENLNIGESILNSEDQLNNNVIEKYCYENLNILCDSFGGLYQWNEMMQFDTMDKKGICPNGWHIPSDKEWMILEGTVDSEFGFGDKEWLEDKISFKQGYRGFDVGKNLKNNEGWAKSKGIDKYGFTVLPIGCMKEGKSFRYFRIFAYFWTSTESKTYSAYAWARQFDYSDKLGRIEYLKKIGFSVRCIKDQN